MPGIARSVLPRQSYTDTSSASVSIGAIIAIVVVVVIIKVLLIIFCCYRYRKMQSQRQTVIYVNGPPPQHGMPTYNAAQPGVPMQNMANKPYEAPPPVYTSKP